MLAWEKSPTARSTSSCTEQAKRIWRFFFFLVKIQPPAPPQAFLITRHYIKPEQQLASVLKGDLEEKYRKNENPDLLLLCFARGWDRSSNNCSRQLMNQSWRWLQ